MIRLVFLSFLFLLPFSAHALRQPVYGNEWEANALFFYKKSDWKTNFLFEARYRDETDGREFRSYRLGAYYRIHKHVKAGLFYRLVFGQRHEDDWRAAVGEGVRWDNPNSRDEH